MKVTLFGNNSLQELWNNVFISNYFLVLDRINGYSANYVREQMIKDDKSSPTYTFQQRRKENYKIMFMYFWLFYNFQVIRRQM
jgi:hypothetical protein